MGAKLTAVLRAFSGFDRFDACCVGGFVVFLWGVADFSPAVAKILAGALVLAIGIRGQFVPRVR